MKSIYALCLISFVLVSQAAEISPGGSDECGVGWSVTQKKSFLATSTRGTTNSFLPPVFSMTSGTSNCDTHSFAQNEQEAYHYASVNQDLLTSDMAKGSGEYLEGLAEVMGCSADSIEGFSRLTKKHFKLIVGSPSPNAEQFYSRIKFLVFTDPQLRLSCLSST